MDSLTKRIKDELIRNGADLVGVGDLTGLLDDVRNGLPIEICVAVKYPKEVICGITELPTQEYRDWYDTLNERLDSLVTLGTESCKGWNMKQSPKQELRWKTDKRNAKPFYPIKP